MEVPRGLVCRPRPSHGVQNTFHAPGLPQIHRTSSYSSYPTYGPPLGDTALYTMDDWIFPRDTRENPTDNSVHDMYASTFLSQGTGDLQEGYWIPPSAYLRDIVPFQGQSMNPPGVEQFIQGNYALATSIYHGDVYHPKTLYSPVSAVSTSMVRSNQVMGQPPLPMRSNEPMGGNLTPGTSSISSHECSSPQSGSRKDSNG